MPRNGSGTASIPNSFTPATTILSSSVNANFTDIASMLTASVASDGQTPMTGALRLDDGSEALPGLAFESDTNTGIRRSGADVLELVTGGADRVQIDDAGKVWALGAFDVAGVADFHGVTTFINTGLHILDTNASHDLIIKPGSDLAADRTLTLVTGDADRTLTLSGDATLPAGTALVVANNLSDVADAPTAFAAIKQAATDSATGVVEIAVQSEMETATDTGRAVVPGRQHFHPGHPKFWGYATVSGGTPTLQTSYNVTSITDAGPGLLTVTIATDFSSANWAVMGALQEGSSDVRIFGVDSGTQAAGSIGLLSSGVNDAENDPEAWHFAGLGDQA